MPGLVLLSLCCFVFLNVSAEGCCFFCLFFVVVFQRVIHGQRSTDSVAPETRVALPVSYILQLRHIINLLRCWDVHGMFPGLRVSTSLGSLTCARLEHTVPGIFPSSVMKTFR